MKRKNVNIRGGLAGRILRVDLSNKTISTETTADYAERFLGGRAVSSFVLLNELSPGTCWSDEDNRLIFGTGCLVGTLAPAACRVSVDTVNVFNNGKGSANFGGHWGPELKYAGFDHVIIQGKAEIPLYLLIRDGTAELRDAGSVWGKTTDGTETILKDELGDNRVRVAAIGPAGENLVKGSGIVADMGKVAGGSGVGCVMGVKKLKAIAVRGHGTVHVAQPEYFMSAVGECIKKIMSSGHGKSFRSGIIKTMFTPKSPIWDYAGDIIRNGQEAFWPLEKRMNLVDSNKGVPKYHNKMTACFNCPIGCIPFSSIDEGKYKGTRGKGYWINSAQYSTRFDVDDPAASLRYHLLANQLGLDGDNTTVVLSWAFECYQRGLIDKDDTDGIELTWGNADAMLEMLPKIAYRQGIGDLLADGVKEASRKLGKGSETFAIHMKGQDSFDAYRASRGWALGLATSPVAGRHLRGAVSGSGASDSNYTAPPAIQYEKQAEAVYWESILKEIEDMAGICVYVGSFFGAPVLEPSDYAGLISSALGIELKEDDLMFAGRQGVNLEKAFNTIHAGLKREDDYPPVRYMKEPIKSGPCAGEKCEKKKFDEMLDQFYELNGWDTGTGWQTRRCLKALDLEDVMERLKMEGRLIDH